MDKPKRWVKNVIKKCNPMAGFVHIWTNSWVKTSQQFLECRFWFTQQGVISLNQALNIKIIVCRLLYKILKDQSRNLMYQLLWVIKWEWRRKIRKPIND